LRRLVSLPLVLLLLTLLAFGLRVYGLDYQPLRGDESFSIQFSAHELDWLFPNIANIEPNPPLYYLLLHYWMAVLGQSEFATRFLSLLFGVISVPIIYQLARSMGRPNVGILASTLVAINPFQVWHAQDVRNYTVWPALSMASLVFLLLALREGRLKYWVGYVGLALLSVYTHYYDLFLLLFQNLFFLAVVACYSRTKGVPGARRRVPVFTWLISQGFLAVSFVPWLIYGSSRLAEVTEGSSPPLWDVFSRCLTAFAVGETVPGAFRTAVLPLLLLLLVGGLTLAFRTDRYHATFLMLYIVVPSICVFSAAQVRPLFRERYLNAIAPAYYLTMSWALMSARRDLPRWRNIPLVLGMAFFGLSAGYSLHNYYHNPEYQKSPDWRSLTDLLERETGPGDVIILNYPDPTFSYYYDGRAPSEVLPRGLLSEEEKADTALTLKYIAQRYDRIWFYPLTDVRWDNVGYVEKWLNRHALLLEERDIHGFRWLIYAPTIVGPEDIRCPLQTQMGESILLRGYDADSCFRDYDQPYPVTAGSTLRIVLYWEALDPVRESYSVFLHLVDSMGCIWTQRDGPPLGGDFPTEDWMPGDVIVDPYVMTIPSNAPCGLYSLVLGMYDPATGHRLPLVAEDGTHTGDSLTIVDLLVD
jgi:4-amino-4-deoxy-L-arabinose transferase-like glycosyltransferase